MTDMVYNGWSGLEGVEHGAEAVKVPFGNNEIVFSSGFNVNPGDLKIPAAGGAYLSWLQGQWGWQSVPVADYASLQLVHVRGEGESVVETIMLNHEINALHDTDGYGDIGFSPGAIIAKFGLAVVEGPGYFELRASQSAHAEDMTLTLEIVIVKL